MAIVKNISFVICHYCFQFETKAQLHFILVKWRFSKNTGCVNKLTKIFIYTFLLLVINMPKKLFRSGNKRQHSYPHQKPIWALLNVRTPSGISEVFMRWSCFFICCAHIFINFCLMPFFRESNDPGEITVDVTKAAITVVMVSNKGFDSLHCSLHGPTVD